MINVAAIRIDEFWARVEKGPKCWEWRGKRARMGRPIEYGFFSIKTRVFYAHRVSWVIAHGPIPEGKVVRHRCDNPGCVRPSHLRLGSQLANVRDSIRRRRNLGRIGDNHWTHLKPESVPRGERSFSARHPERMLRGEALPQAKLTPDKVREIRERLSNGETQESIAPLYNVTRTAISAIATRRTWRHVK